MFLVVPAPLATSLIFCIHPTSKEVGFLLKRIVREFFLALFDTSVTIKMVVAH
jgi:hypothetical protein